MYSNNRELIVRLSSIGDHGISFTFGSGSCLITFFRCHLAGMQRDINNVIYDKNQIYIPASSVTGEMPPTSFIGRAVTKNAGIPIPIAAKHIGITIYPGILKKANGMHNKKRKFDSQGIIKTGS